MSGLAGTLHALQQALSPAGPAADQWLLAIRALAQNPKSTRIVLPIRNPAGRWIPLEPALTAFPQTLESVRNAGVKDALRIRYRQLAATAACSPPEIVRKLSELAAETASFRVLLTSDDAFDVTGRGVLTVAALINGLQLLTEFKQTPDRPPTEFRKLARRVWWPLRLCDTDFTEHRPGDVWLADLAARTFREGARAVTHNFQDKASLQLFGSLTLEFVVRSTLHKLLETEALPKFVIQNARYDLWPGFESIVSAADAGSLRQVLATELVRQVAEQPTGSSAVALLRLLGRLPAMPAEFAWTCRLFIAQILWELLECDPEVLKKLMSIGQAATTLLAALRFLREWKVDEPSPPDLPVRNRLADVMSSLESYEQFRSLQKLLDVGRSAVPAGRAAASPVA